MNQEHDKYKIASSSLDTGSSTGNYVDPFALMELQDNVSVAVSKVESLHKSVAQLDSKLDAKVSGLNTKLDAILKSLSDV